MTLPAFIVTWSLLGGAHLSHPHSLSCCPPTSHAGLPVPCVQLRLLPSLVPSQQVAAPGSGPPPPSSLPNPPQPLPHPVTLLGVPAQVGRQAYTLPSPTPQSLRGCLAHRASQAVLSGRGPLRQHPVGNRVGVLGPVKRPVGKRVCRWSQVRWGPAGSLAPTLSVRVLLGRG